MKISLKNRIVWLCGASSGIGFALAEELHRRGAKLVLSSRNLNNLNVFRDALLIKCDVTCQEDWHNSTREVIERFGRVDTFIYNAGNCEYVDIADYDTGVFERMMEVNFIGLTRAVEHLLPLLKGGEKPHLVAVGSSVSWFPLPRAEAYGASKAAVSYFLNSLRVDLEALKIDVSTIKPGFVKTPLTDRNDFPMPFIISAEKAALRICAGLEKRYLSIDFPRRFTWPLRFMSHLPVYLQHIISRRFVKS